jgi:glycosyltransferase involved in cell wall biosynthesis
MERNVKILTYCNYDNESIINNLDKTVYDYEYILEIFTPVLKRLGKVINIKSPFEEVDKIYHECLAKNERCVFLVFMPPHLSVIGLDCPTYSIFAWGYSTIPDTIWNNDLRNDWCNIFAAQRKAITFSNYTVDIVKSVMGEKFPIVAIPPPVWQRIQALKNNLRVINKDKLVKIFFNGVFIDSNDIKISDEKFTFENTITADKSALKMLFFFRKYIFRLLPSFCLSPLKFTKRKVLQMRNKMKNSKYVNNSITFDSSIFYTAVLDNGCESKDYINIITAFCWAHRENSEVTLIVKLHLNDNENIHQAYKLLTQLLPFKCRIIFIFGFMGSNEYAKLISLTTYYVNASSSAGVCIPLLKFMSYGVPVISPAHTAMADYIFNENAFIVKSSFEINVWPHDPHHLYKTGSNRIDWESLKDAYLDSYHIINTQNYTNKANHAKKIIENYCNDDLVEQKMRSFLEI